MPKRSTVVRDVAVLVAVALVVRGIGAWLVSAPPHVDAAYYTMVAEQLATGRGFTAPAIWSFLEVGGRLPADPILPTPSNGHWMPMTAVVSAASMFLLGPEWRAGQVPMVALSALLVPATYLIGWWLWRSRRIAILAAALMLAAGPLLLMYPLVESFAIFGVLGTLALAASVRAVESSRPGPWLILAGLAAALASLTRIDGVLLTLAPATAWLLHRPLSTTSRFGGPMRALAWGGLAGTMYLLVVAPWLLRDLAVFGTPFPSPGGRMIWIRDYNEHLSISLDLTVDRYLDWGAGAIIGSKARAAAEVLGRTLALFGGVFGVFFFAGLWIHRADRRLVPVIVYMAAMFAVMVLIVTEHAPKGAFLHTAPAWLPFAMPMAVASVGPASSAAGRFWPFLRRPATHRFLEVAALVGALALSIAGAITLGTQWTVRTERTEQAAAFLRSTADTSDVLLAGDPSSLYLQTGLRGVATPFDPYAVVGEVVDAYGIDWVVVILEPGTEIDPLGLWDGAAAVDATGASPEFLPDRPAYEGDGVRVYEVRETGW